MSAIKKIVLAYSGGLDTSVILKWLKEKYQCPVVAFAADLGQGEELADVAEKARATGADEVYIAVVAILTLAMIIGYFLLPAF